MPACFRSSVAALAFLFTLGLTPAVFAQQSPGNTPREAETYRQLELFARVLSYVENNYVEPVDQRKLMYGAIKGMMETLDPHTQFLSPEDFRAMKVDTTGEFGGLGIEISKREEAITVVAPLDDTPAARAGIRAGDQIVAVDGEATRGMELAQVIRMLRGPPGKRVVLSIMREGFNSPQEIVVLRDHIRIQSVEAKLYDGIGHVRVKNFQERTDLSLRKELERLRAQNGGRELRGLVLDLRNNPGGLLDQAVAISDRFLPADLPIVSTRGRNGRNATEEKSRGKEAELAYPIVVLVNAGSASASEIVAGALQDHRRATVMGVQTFGKGSVQTVIELEDGSGLKLTIARYYTPKGRSIQERGITPDFLVEEDAALQAKAITREKDLDRHFKGEGPEKDPSAPARTLPPLAAWPVAEEVKDHQLKTALTWLHHHGQSSHGRNTASVETGR